MRYCFIIHCTGVETHEQLVLHLLVLLILHSSPGTLELQELLELWDGVTCGWLAGWLAGWHVREGGMQ